MVGPVVASAEVRVDLDGSRMPAEARRAADNAADALDDRLAGQMTGIGRKIGDRFGRAFITGSDGQMRQVPLNAVQAIEQARLDEVGRQQGREWLAGVAAGARERESYVQRVLVPLAQSMSARFRLGGREAGSEFTQSLALRLVQENIAEKIGALFGGGRIGDGARRGGNAAGGAFMGGFDNAILGRMDRTVAMVIRLIGAAAPQMAALGSALSAGAVGLLSSALVGLSGSLIALGPAITGLVVGGTLLATTWGDLVKGSGDLAAAVDRVSAAWSDQAAALGSQVEPALSSLIDHLAQVMEGSNLGAALGEGLAGAIGAFDAVLASPGFQAFMSVLTTQVPDAISSLGTGFAGLTQALVTMFGQAGPVLTQLSDDFAAWGQAVADTADRVAASDGFATFFQRAYDSLQALIGVLSPLTQALGNVFMIGSDSGNQLLGVLAGLAERFLAFTESSEGAAQIGEWFSQSLPVIESLFGLIGAVGGALAQMVTPQVIAQVTGLLDGIAELAPVLGQALSAIGQANIIGIVVQALVGIGDAIGPLLPLIGSLASAIGSIDPSVIQALGVAFGVLFTGAKITGFVTGLINAAKAGQGLFSVLGGIFTLARTGTPILQGIGLALRAAFSAGPIGLIIAAVAALVAGLIYFFTQTKTGQRVVKAATEGILAAWNAVASWFTGTLLPVLQGVWDAIVAGVQGIGGFFASVWQGILAAPQAVLDWFTGTLLPFFAGLPAQIGGFLLQVAEFFLQLPFRIIDALVNLPFQIVEFFTNAFSALATFLGTAVGEVIVFFQGLPRRIGEAVGTLSVILVEWATNAWNSAYDAVVTAVTTMVEWVKGLPYKIGVAVGTLAARLVTWAIDAWTRARESTVSAATSMVTWVVGLPGRILTALGDLAGRLWTFMSNAWREAYNGMSERGQDTVDWVAGLPGRILGALGNLASTLWNAGSEIISGLWRGMQDAWSNVTDWVGGLAGRIADLKGPLSYDRRLLIPAGRAILQGLQRGMRMELPALDRAVGGVTAMLAGIGGTGDGLNFGYQMTGAGGGVGGAVAGRSVVIEPGAIQVVTPLSDPRLVAQQMLDRLVVRIGG